MNSLRMHLEREKMCHKEIILQGNREVAKSLFQELQIVVEK
jgi:hypothetical protein